MLKKVVIPAVLISLTFWMLISLGQWQLNRAEEKRQLELAIVEAQVNPAQMVFFKKQVMVKEHYPVLLEGQFDNNKQFIYDNQIVRSTAGYYVLTPFIIEKSNDVILVNRGFVPWRGQRDKLVNIDVKSSNQIIKVKLTKHVQRKLLKEQKIKGDFPFLIQSLNLEKLNALTGYKIVPMLALLDEEADDGFFRQWQPFYGSVDKHMGYAVQWFAMAFTLFVIAVRILYKNRKMIFQNNA